MKSPLRCLLGSLFFATGSAAALAQGLPPGISGTWYNPQQAGHGLSITVHSPDDALVYWYTGDHSGNPLLLYTEAHYDGSTLSGDALQSRGIRFGSFNPADNRLTRWGGIELELLACDRLKLRFDANGPAGGADYGSGEIEMRKLAGVDGVVCVDPEPAVGLYQGTLEVDGQSSEPFQALFSADGSIHLSFNRGLRTDGTVLIGEGYPGQGFHMVFAGYREPSFYQSPVDPLYRLPTSEPVFLINAHVEADSRQRSYVGELQAKTDRLPAARIELTPMGDERADDFYRRDVPVAALKGQYSHDDAFLNFNNRSLSVAADGQFQGVDSYYSLDRACTYTGQFNKPLLHPLAWGQTIEPSIEFSTEFALTGCSDRDGYYRGRAWVDSLSDDGKPQSLRIAAIREESPSIAFQFAAARSE